MNTAGSANDPIMVTTGEMDGLEAFIKPPMASKAPMMKQIIDATLILHSSAF